MLIDVFQDGCTCDVFSKQRDGLCCVMFVRAEGWCILDVFQNRHGVYFMFPKQKDGMYLMFFNAILDIFQSKGMVNSWFLSRGGGGADNMLIQKLIVMVLSPLLPLTLLAPKTLDGGQQQDQPLQRPVTPGQRRGPESVRETVASRWKCLCVLGSLWVEFSGVVAVFAVVVSFQSVIRWSVQFFLVIWGNLWETGWSTYGLLQAHRYHLELNWKFKCSYLNGNPLSSKCNENVLW